MKDKGNQSLNIGDKIITTVSKKSIYLATGTITEINEQDGKLYITYDSTPAGKWILPKECCKIKPHKPILNGELGIFRDCTSMPVNLGDKVYYRTTGDGGFSIGEITSIKSDLWATVDNKIKVRNVSIYII